MKYEEFRGELDKPTGLEEFTGQLDEPTTNAAPAPAQEAVVDRPWYEDVFAGAKSALGIGSVMEGYEGKAADDVRVSRAPLTKEARAAFEAAYEKATPAKKLQLEDSASPMAGIAREKNDYSAKQEKMPEAARKVAKQVADTASDKRPTEVRAYEPTIKDRIDEFLGGGNKYRAMNEAAAKRIAAEQGISVDEVYRSVGGSRPIFNPEGRGSATAVSEATQVLGKELPNVPAGTANAVLRAIRGGDIGTTKTTLDKMIDATERKAASDDPNYQSFNQLGNSIGYSLSTLVATAAASAVGAAASPLVGLASGAAASTAVAYRASKDDFLSRVKDNLDAESRRAFDRPMSDQEWEDAKKKFNAAATKYGAWEAIPETVSNLIFMRAFASPLLMAGKNSLPEIAGRLAKQVAITQVPEHVTETITALGQNAAEREGGLTNDKLTVEDAFKQQLIPTLLNTGAMHAGATAAQGAHSLYVNKIEPRVNPAGSIARVIEDGVNNTSLASTDAQAVAALNPDSYDPSLIAPSQTARRPSDVGSSPLIGTGIAIPQPVEPPEENRETRFELQGLSPIVVPATPAGVAATGALGVSEQQIAAAEREFKLDTLRTRTTNGNADATRVEPAAGSQQSGSDLTGSVAPAGPVDAGLTRPDAPQRGSGITGNAAAPVSGGAGQPTAVVAAPQNNNADTSPVEIWTGRRGDGYVTEADAQQALPGRQKRQPELSWAVEQMPSGKYRLAGYAAQTTETPAAAVIPERLQSASATETPAAPAMPERLQTATASSIEAPAMPERLQTASTSTPDRVSTPAVAEAVGTTPVARLQSATPEAPAMPERLQTATAQAPAVAAMPERAKSATVEAPAIPERATAPAPAPIYAPSGKPFSTEKTAAVYAQQSNITDYTPVRVDGGWAIQSSVQAATPATTATQESVNAPQAAQAVQGQAQGQETPAALSRQPDELALPQGPLPDAVIAKLGRNPQSADVRATVQQTLNQWALSTGNVAPKLDAPDADAETTVNLLGNLFGETTGIGGGKVVAYSSPGGENGFTYGGYAFVNTAPDTDVAAPRTTLHELKHYAERMAERDTRAGLTGSPAQKFVASIDSVFDDMTDAGKRSYVENFLHKAELNAISDPAARAARLQELVAAPATRSEMTADFLGNRATDRGFLIDLARKDPGGFEGFVKKWLSVIDNLIAQLRGSRTQGAKESAKVDQAVRDLNKAKMVARDALIEFRRGNLAAVKPAQAQTAQAEEPVQSRREADQLGEFKSRTMRDGTMVVYGNPEEIRDALPEGVVGRVTKDGIMFTNAAAPRVRAALEGRKVAYSRGGQVVDKLPMKDGKYVGAPEKFNTPGKIPTLRKWLRQLAVEGEAGRFWYENSGKEVLKMVRGDVQEARRFVALLAIYSPQAKVDANSTFGLRAWAQYKVGQPISVKTAVQDKKAREALADVDAFWSGEKTGNFFFNLLREIDPSTAGKQGATIDMWMMRAGQYSNDAPTATQYSFMENETNRLAQELGWEPQQVQAAIWVAMKARMENSGVKKRTEASSEKKGWIRYDYPVKNGRPTKTRVILNAAAHRDNWLKHAFEHDPSASDTAQAKFDFGDGLRRHIGQISFEARPGRSTGVLPGIHSAPYAQQVEFQQAVQAAFLDENGVDLLAQFLGLLVDTNDILLPGVWQGEVSPSSQKLVAMAPAKGDAGKSSVDPAQAEALNVYAAVAGLVARQEGVGWHRPFYAGTKRDANGLDIDIGRAINPAEAKDLEAAIGQWMDENGKAGWQDQFALISAPTGIRIVNFGIIENAVLQEDVLRVAESVLPDFTWRAFASDGDMPTNNWKENPNGQGYVQRIGAAGRSDVLDWARAVLAPRVQQVFDDFSKRYEWGDPGSIQFSRRQRDGGGRQEGGRAARGSLAASEQAVPQEALTALPGAPRVRGFTGPDPRLVSVAKKYARDNGIDLRRQSEYVQVDEDRASRIASAYADMKHDPQNPRVKQAYQNLIRQTIAQYRALEDAGYQFWFVDMSRPENVDYVSTPWNAMRDIRANQTMGVFPTSDGFGSGATDLNVEDNPLLQDTGFRWPVGSADGKKTAPVLANDLFRAVHDAFGHGLEGAGFRAQGEENAWQAHARLFTGSAVGAITSETRGQNSWLNYGPYGEANRTAKVEDTVFADQKTGLMPEWTWTEGRAGDAPSFSRRETNDQQTDTPEFKRWFGDSKVVDANGRPLVVYHGTAEDFYVFDPSRAGRNYFSSGAKRGMFFTSNADTASVYAEQPSGAYLNPEYPEAANFGDGKASIMPVYLSLQNPLVITTKKSPDKFFDGKWEDIFRRVDERGHDGVIVRGGEQFKRDLYVAMRPEQIKSATGNTGAFDPTNPDIRFSRRQPNGWLIDRDEAGRFRFAGGAQAYSVVANIANALLDKVGMKPISTDLGRAMRQMKVELDKSRNLTVDVAKELNKLTPAEREMISDVIEGELKAGVHPPQRVLALAAAMQKIMAEQTQQLIDLGMMDPKTAMRWEGKYLPRFYEKNFKDDVQGWARAAQQLLGRVGVMQGVKGNSLKARGLFETIPVGEVQSYIANGWEIRDENFDPAVNDQIVVWRDFTRAERENMKEIRDAMFRFVMGYNRTQRDVALGRLYERLAQSHASRGPKDGYVLVPDTKVEGTNAKRYGKLAGMFVPKEVLDHLQGYDSSMDNELYKLYRRGLGMWKEGKALALDTPIPTPNGWSTMGDLKVGDRVFDEHGKECEVMFATDVQLDRKCYEVEFSDGEIIVADAEHLWFTADRGVPGVRTTDQILSTLKYADGRYNRHSIPVAGALSLPDANLPIDPYFLGVWLGNGTSRNSEITSCESDSVSIITLLKSRGFGIGSIRKDPRGDIVTYQVGFKDHKPRNQVLKAELRSVGVLGNKHIPTAYLRASEAQRMDLLRGLMDTDGTIDAHGKVSFSTASDQILDGFLELSRSLGFKPVASEVYKKFQGGVRRAWVVRFHATSDLPVFMLERKRARLIAPVDRKARSRTRQIVAIRPVDSVPVKCIQVSSESRLYLAGRGMIPTHNTVLNPVSHGNNIMSNLTMAHFAGVSYWDTHKYVGAIRDLVKKDPMVQEAKDAGLFGGTFSQEDLLDNMPEQLKMLGNMSESTASKSVDKVWNALSFWLRKPLGKAYEAEDLFFRYLIYRDARKRGLDTQDAIDYSQAFIFTYDDLPKGARFARDFALPFFSYTYKAIPVLARTALEYPWRFAAPAAALYGINTFMYAMAAGADEDDDWKKIIQRYVTDGDFRDSVRATEEMERANLPPWMKGYSFALGTPKAVRLGMDDMTNLPLYLDVSRVFPGGDLLDATNNAGGVAMLQPLVPSNPLLNTVGAMLWNKDPFFGKELVDKNDTTKEAAQKRAKWLWNQFVPSIAVGSYHFDRAMNVIAQTTGRPVDLYFNEYTGTGKDGLPVQGKLAAMQTFGVKVRPIDLEMSADIEKSDTQRMIRDLDAEIRRIRRLEQKGAISPDNAATQIEYQREKRQRLRQGEDVNGDPIE